MLPSVLQALAFIHLTVATCDVITNHKFHKLLHGQSVRLTHNIEIVVYIETLNLYSVQQ